MVTQTEALMIGLGALGLGGGLIVYRRMLDAKVQASLKWPSTQGEITRSEDGGSTFDIQYTYTIGSRQHSSNKVYMGPNIIPGTDIYNWQSIVAKFPKGKRVTIFYNPNNHQESFLEREIRGSFLYYFFGIQLLIVGIVFLLAAFGIISITEGGANII